MGKGHTATTAQRRFTCATILLFLLLAPAWGWGQTTIFSDNFETGYSVNTGLNTSGANQWLVKVMSGSNTDIWAIGNGAGALTGSYGLTVYNTSGGYASYDYNQSTDQIAYRNIDARSFTGLTIDFKWKCIGEKLGSTIYDYGKVVYSLDGTTWTDVSSTQYCNKSTKQSVTNLAIPSAVNGKQFYIGFRWNCDYSGGADPSFTVDDIVIKGDPTTPTLTTIPSSIDFGFIASGTTSSSNYFDLMGTDLTGVPGDITVTAPAGFEVSDNSSTGFGSSVSISYSSSSLNWKRFYVRFKPTAKNTTYSDNITISGGGATQTMALNGSSVVTYCSSNGNPYYSFGITGMQFGTLSKTSLSTSGYSDFTTESATLSQGNNYQMTVNVNTRDVNSGNNYPISARAWIDWNQNGIFTDAGEQYDLGNANRNGATNLSPISINIPSTAALGSTRMRVSANYSAYPTSCGTGFNGEVEDYTINVVPAATTYYSRGADPTKLSSWSTSATGTINSPASFTANNQIFVVQNNMAVNTAWSVSGTGTKLQVQGGAALTANAPITLSPSTTFHLDANATYNHNVANDAVWAGTEVIAATSTVVYGAAGVQNVVVPAGGAYGNLTISGGGTKTMQGSLLVKGILTLDNGNISLGSGASNLTLSDGASITGAFDATHMVVCDGDGSFIKQSSTAADFVIEYPVGTGALYTPYRITSLNATPAGLGSVSVRAVPSVAPGPVPANSTDLKKYWAVATSNLAITSADISFAYHLSEVGIGGDKLNYIPYYYDGTAWSIPAVASGAGTNPMTVSGATNLTGQWTAREQPLYKTYYSYQSGSWDTPTTWTTDPSGTLSVSPSVPTPTDRVVILNGRMVKTLADGYNVLSVQVNEGGTLDLGGFTNQQLTTVRGQGVVRLSSPNFPVADWTNFVSAGGGTVEYYNSSDFDFSQLTYNNLIVNLSANDDIATLRGNMLINGSLTITRGKLQVNTNTSTTSRNIAIMGSVYVSANGSMGIGTGNANHRIIVNGNFTNDGVVRFTNQAAPAYKSTPTNGTSDVVFNNGTADQNLLCNGLSDFYRIEIDKGIDQTYVLNIDASDDTKFKLFGRNDQQVSPPAGTPPGLENSNSLGLLAGTVRLGPNIVLPSISDKSVYNIDLDAQLWLDGASVTTTSVASNSSIVVYGKLKISNNGQLVANGDQGIVMRDQSSLEVESGVVTTPCIRTSAISGVHRGAFNLSGGTINITGNSFSSTGGYATFTMPYPDNVFKMSGGVINILAPTTSSGGGNGVSFSCLLGLNANNATITGGTINITVPTTRNAYINTTVPLWNLNFISTSSTSRGQIKRYAGNGSPSIPIIEAQPLVVYNDLNIQNSAIFNANGSDVTVGHNFTIDSGAGYEPVNNTTTFNGIGGQRFTNSGIVNNGTGLYNLTITNKSNLDIFSNDLIVRNNLAIDASCFLNDVGHSIRVNGNIANSGTHASQASGALLLNGTSNQVISGSGLGVFGNVNLNNAAGATITANQSVEGNLRFARGIFDIGSYNLKLGSGSSVYDALTGTATLGFSGTKMVKLAGLQSDAGVTKTYSSTANFLYPIGTASDYTPATIQIGTAPTTWGDVTVRPVAQIQPFATSANALSYYWKVASSGFAGLQPNSVTHTYKFVDSDIVGVELSYIPAAYRPYSWVPINDVSKVVDGTNTVLFNGISFVDGDYTAGYLSAFAPVKVFYSRQDGDWNKPETWATDKVGGTVLPLTPVVAGVNIPGPSNPVVIGDATHNHIVTVPVGLNGITTGGLQINSGSTLDITTTKNHNFGSIPDTKVLGTGLLRISSSAGAASFPGGDFGNFLSSGGGTVEYYGATPFTLPTTYTSSGNTVSIATYNKLVTSPATGSTITLPNANLLVYNTYSVGGAGVSQLNSTATLQTLTVGKQLEVLSGATLRYPNGGAQSVVANGDVLVNGTFDVRTGGTATNLLSIQGNLTNNGIFNMYASATRVCNVTFTGDTDKEINGTGVTTSFNTITVDKGSSRNTLLEVKSSALSLNTTLATALTLTNGTFRLTSPLTLALTNSGSFAIPISGCLSANGGTINIGGGSATDATDLKLDGRLEVLAGAINIGTLGENYNNDIEYSSGGTPEVIVGGTGKLFVNGQIRRVTTINTGSLSYSQSGSSEVTIAGRNAINSRSMLEVLNAGSKFDMSGTSKLTLTGNFNNATGTTDLYLAPEFSTVTGGKVVFGSSATLSPSFNMVTSVPLWNVTVDGTTSSKEVNLRIYPLTLKGSLAIEGNSVLKANGLDVTIAGNLTNGNGDAGSGVTTGGYQAGLPTQTTTFNGSSNQMVEGSGSNLTNFGNVVAASLGTLTLNPNTNIRVNRNLTISRGILSDGGNTITQIGDVFNQAVHLSSTTTGGLRFEGTQPQLLSGSGSGILGNVLVSNSMGITARDNFQINGVLTFNSGSIYLDDYLLTLGVNAAIAGISDKNSMLILNGVISDAGVKKIFKTGASTFTFPIGVAGKYTPVKYTFGANTSSNASITVKPVNYIHPSAAAPASDQLKYYWNVASSGFSGSYSVDHSYTYVASDVIGTAASYVAGRFVGGTWTPSAGIAGGVDGGNHQVKLTGKNFIDGEYTAGDDINFVSLPTLYSIKSGGWFTSGTWSTSPGGGSCGCIPNGNPVVISSTHTVTLGANYANAYSVDIQGVLDIGTTVYHSVGHVTGAGKLILGSTNEGIFVFPGGNFDVFAATTGSTIEFKGDNEATLPLKPGNNYKPYQNVIFSGAGKKMITAEDLKVVGNLTISAGATLSNELFSKTITCLGNWTDGNGAATGGFIPGKGLVTFNGSAAQTLSVSNGATTEQFYNLKVDNAAGITISGMGNAAVSNVLYLTKGNITTTTTNLLSITNPSTRAVVGGGSSSFVNGPLQKRFNSGGQFAFPVGDASQNRYGEVVVSDVSASGDYLAQYLSHNPKNEGYDPAIKTAPVDVVSSTEYWKITGNTAATGNVTLRWDGASTTIPVSAASRQKLRVVEWNSSWINRGNQVADGGVASGTVKTAPAPVSLNGDHFMTIGVESLPTATITGGTASICDDGSSTSIPITLTGTGPWNIKYKINGANETSISNIATSPYSLVVSNALPVLASGGPNSYKFTISYIQDNTGSTGVSDFTTSATITLNESPNPVITGLTTTPQGSIVTYQTPQVAGHTYSWSVVSGGVIQGSPTLNQVSVKWGTVTSGTLRLTETVTVGGCSKVTPDYIVAITDIPAPVITGNSTVCNGSTNTYSTPIVGSHTYLWTVVGGTPTTGTSNSINVTWVTPGIGSVTVAEKGSSTVPVTLPVTVNTIPSIANSVSDATICNGSTASIVVTGAAAGIEYQLRLNTDNSTVGTSVSSMGGGDVTLTTSPVVPTVYNVWATNEHSCSVQLTDLSTVTLKTNPSFTLAVDNTNSCAGGNIKLTVTSTDGATYTWPVADSEIQSVSSSGKVADITWKPNSGLTFTSFPPQVSKTLNVTGTLNGCLVTKPVNVIIYRLPVTGPPYHVGNNVAK
jgi:hypothetical protein